VGTRMEQKNSTRAFIFNFKIYIDFLKKVGYPESKTTASKAEKSVPLSELILISNKIQEREKESAEVKSKRRKCGRKKDNHPCPIS
jgi:hypothetical protein